MVGRGLWVFLSAQSLLIEYGMGFTDSQMWVRFSVSPKEEQLYQASLLCTLLSAKSVQGEAGTPQKEDSNEMELTVVGGFTWVFLTCQGK